MSSLDKVLLAAGSQDRAVEPDQASQLVQAAASLIDELAVLLSWDPDDDDSPPGGDAGQGDGPNKAKKPAKTDKKSKGSEGENADDEDDDELTAKKKAARKGNKRNRTLQAAALCGAARIVLSGLAGADAEDDWVEATSAPCTSGELLALAAGKEPAEPYGAVPYADPGYRGKKRYPIDKEHIHAAIGYFSKAANRAAYSASQVKNIWGRIRGAASKFGIKMGDEGNTVTAAGGLDDAMVALAGMPPSPDMPMHHGPFNGQHSHSHVVRSVQTTKHFHNNDSSHDTGSYMGGASAY